MVREHHAVAYFGQSKEDIVEEHLKNRELLSGLQSGLKKDFLED
jgi:hypothetical protein